MKAVRLGRLFFGPCLPVKPVQESKLSQAGRCLRLYSAGQAGLLFGLQVASRVAPANQHQATPCPLRGTAAAPKADAGVYFNSVIY